MKKQILPLMIAALSILLVACAPTSDAPTETIPSQNVHTEPTDNIQTTPTDITEETQPAVPVDEIQIVEKDARKIVKTGLGSVEDVTQKFLDFSHQGMYPERTVTWAYQDVITPFLSVPRALRYSTITFANDSPSSWMVITVTQDSSNFSDVSEVSLLLDGDMSDFTAEEMDFITVMFSDIFGDLGEFIIKGADVDGLCVDDNHEMVSINPKNLYETAEPADDVCCSLIRTFDEELFCADIAFSSSLNFDTSTFDIVSDDMDIGYSYSDVFNVDIPSDQAFSDFTYLIDGNTRIQQINISELAKVQDDHCGILRLGFSIFLNNGDGVEVRFTTGKYDSGETVMSLRGQTYSAPDEHNHDEAPLEEVVQEEEEHLDLEPLTKQEFADIITAIASKILSNAHIQYDGNNILNISYVLMGKVCNNSLLIETDENNNFMLVNNPAA